MKNTEKQVQTLRVTGEAERSLRQRGDESIWSNRHEREGWVWRQRTMAWVFCLWLAALGTSHGGLIVGYYGTTPTISSDSPSIWMSLYNDAPSGSISLGGVNFFLTVGGGTSGPTLSVTSGAGVDLVTGTLFASGFGQFPIGTEQSRSQAWGTLVNSPGVSLAAGQTVRLATLTFDSFPVGSYMLDFSGTSFADPQGGTIGSVTLPSEMLTVVPEPVNVALPVFGGMVALAGGYRWWYRRKASAC